MYYYHPKWFGQGSKPDFLNDIFRELWQWTAEIVDKFEEFPAGYTEWTLTGHLALAAYRSDFYALQDYTVPGFGRPDLYIRREHWKDECIIEVKSDGIALERDRQVTKKIEKKLSESWEQASRRPKEESRYRCGLLGLTVWAHTRKWENMCSTPRLYGHVRNELWKKFLDGVVNARWDFNRLTCQPSFCCGYFLRYDQTSKPRREAKKYGKEASKLRGFPFAVGQLWTGIIRRS
jgi:hypothetical protein